MIGPINLMEVRNEELMQPDRVLACRDVVVCDVVYVCVCECMLYIYGMDLFSELIFR